MRRNNGSGLSRTESLKFEVLLVSTAGYIVQLMRILLTYSSRGLTASDLQKSDNWWRGPMFLTFPEDQWPSKPVTSSLEENVFHEIKAEFK